MKPVIITILLAIFCTEPVSAQGWIKRNNAPNSLSFATSSAAVGKGFLTGLGTATYAYDTATLSWTQVATMPGNVRTSPVSGTLNDKVFCGLGMATYWSSSPNAVTHREFYKYDPATNIWSQVATFPGKARWLWANFALNNKFYVTLGKTFLGGPGYCKDTWEYDPGTDVWSLKDSFPGGYRDDATSFSINGKGYVVGGIVSATAANELWQYDPGTNSWAQKASCPVQDNGGIAFSIGSYGYYLTGNTYVDSPRFYKYDPANDLWTRLPDFPGPDRNVAASFAIGRSGFITTGQHAPDPRQPGLLYDLNDLWEYNLDCPADIINDLSVNNYQQLYCGDTITIDSIKAYAVQNSSAAYNWLTSTDGINYTAVTGGSNPLLTNLSLTQTTYYKRIVTLNTKCFDTSYAIKFEIEHYKFPVIDTSSGTSVCFGDTVLLHCNNPYSKRWYVNGNWSPDTTSIFKASASGNYSVIATNIACQFSSDTITVTIHPPTPIPTIHLNPTLDSLVCDTAAVAYQWYWGVGIPIPGETNNQYYPSDSGDYYVVITDSNGCTAKSAPIHFTLPVNVSGVSPNVMTVFPNPFADVIYFNTPGVYTHYRLVSIQGQTVLEGKLLVSQKSIDLSALDQGYYVLDLYDRQGYCFRYKISKQ